jgi:hypothetical protein
MHGSLKCRGYRLYAPDSPEARALLAEQGLGPADLECALARFERTESTTVHNIVGINEDGVFGTIREGWRPDLPGASNEPFVPLLWLKVHELLGRVPKGSTARFIQNGALPADTQAGVTVCRLASGRARCEHRSHSAHFRRRGLVPGRDSFAGALASAVCDVRGWRSAW